MDRVAQRECDRDGSHGHKLGCRQSLQGTSGFKKPWTPADFLRYSFAYLTTITHPLRTIKIAVANQVVNKSPSVLGFLAPLQSWNPVFRVWIPLLYLLNKVLFIILYRLLLILYMLLYILCNTYCEILSLLTAGAFDVHANQVRTFACVSPPNSP